LTDTLTVFLYALGTALATGLGALPLLAVRRVPPRWMGLANAVAAGLMLTASFRLIQEGIEYGMGRTVLGVLVGLLFIAVTQGRLDDDGVEVEVGQLRGADARKALLIVGVMTLHSFAEGMGVGVSFGGEEGFGIFVSAAIAVHNIPEGLAISLVLVPRGVSVAKAGFWSVFSSLPQPLIAVPAFLLVSWFTPFLPVGLGLAAGAMIWMVVSELFPDAYENSRSEAAATATTIAVVAMLILQWLLD
jgi:zinc transporter ZupT